MVLAQHVGYRPAWRPVGWVSETKAEEDMSLAGVAGDGPHPRAQLGDPERLIRVCCKNPVRGCTQQHVLQSLSRSDPCARVVAVRPQDGNDWRISKGVAGPPRFGNRDHVGESIRVIVVLAGVYGRVEPILTPKVTSGRLVLLASLEHQIDEGALVGRR